MGEHERDDSDLRDVIGAEMTQTCDVKGCTVYHYGEVRRVFDALVRLGYEVVRREAPRV